MVNIEIIGNIGADAKVVNYNGSQFVSFNVCDNRKVNDQEISMWYGCNLNKCNENLFKYLKKGQQVYVEGSYKTNDWVDQQGAKHRDYYIKAFSVQLLGNN